jgi:hexokinase
VIDLSSHQLEEIIRELRQRIAEGLREPDQQVRCLPAYLAAPASGIKGKALVVDAGGTNLRSALIDLDNKENPVVAGPEQLTLFADRDQQVDRDAFFVIQAKLVDKLGAPDNLPLGYCFSYPAEVHPDGDATLINWTKGITIPGVEGTRVGQGLSEALAASGHPISGVKVMNDTVASLLGGVWGAPPSAQGFIGLIVGTGTNMATFLPAKRMTKIPEGSWPHAQIAVNLESGNFHPPHLTKLDDAVDKDSNNPGQQRFEKAVSGYYLPFVFEKICPGLAGFDPKLGSGQISEILQSSTDPTVREAARWVVERSADLVAAGLAALGRELNVPNLAVQAEGTLFWNMPGYSKRVEKTLVRLLPKGFTCHLLRVKDVNLVGAACAALS